MYRILVISNIRRIIRHCVRIVYSSVRVTPILISGVIFIITTCNSIIISLFMSTRSRNRNIIHSRIRIRIVMRIRARVRIINSLIRRRINSLIRSLILSLIYSIRIIIRNPRSLSIRSRFSCSYYYGTY